MDEFILCWCIFFRTTVLNGEIVVLYFIGSFMSWLTVYMCVFFSRYFPLFLQVIVLLSLEIQYSQLNFLIFIQHIPCPMTLNKNKRASYLSCEQATHPLILLVIITTIYGQFADWIDFGAWLERQSSSARRVKGDDDRWNTVNTQCEVTLMSLVNVFLAEWC